MSGQQVTASGPLNATLQARAILDTLKITPGRVSEIRTIPFQKIVEALLAEELTPETAVRIAILNNRNLQSELEEVGIAQAELVQAGLFRRGGTGRGSMRGMVEG